MIHQCLLYNLFTPFKAKPIQKIHGITNIKIMLWAPKTSGKSYGLGHCLLFLLRLNIFVKIKIQKNNKERESLPEALVRMPVLGIGFQAGRV